MDRFRTTKADGSVHHHELRFVSHLKHENGDKIEDTWGILPTIHVDHNVPYGVVWPMGTSNTEDRISE